MTADEILEALLNEYIYSVRGRTQPTYATYGGEITEQPLNDAIAEFIEEKVAEPDATAELLFKTFSV